VIVDAQGIAVGQKHRLSAELGDHRVTQQLAAAALAEAAAQQEIAVTVQYEAGDA
jgi:hypothetical protein